MSDSEQQPEDNPTTFEQENIDAPHRQGGIRRVAASRVLRGMSLFIFGLLVIELLDELVFGVREAAWPLIRDDLGLTYVEIGLLLGVPNLVSSVIEPFIGILGDVWRRRVLVLGGGVVYGLALLVIALSGNFLVLLVGFACLYPASGSFVALSEAALMDNEPARHEQNMARWTFAGSLGVVGGSLAVSAASGLGVGWRPLFFALAVITFGVVALVWPFRFPSSSEQSEEHIAIREGMVNAFKALRRGEVLRWLVLLMFSDFMLDVLLGFLALYFTDVVRVPPEQAALAVLVWTVVGLVGDFLLIPLLERVRGLSYLRISAAVELVLFAAFLLVPYIWAKFGLLALLGLFNAGWYSILKGNLYSSMPGQSGTVLTISNIFGLVAGLIPAAFGIVSESFGLQATMWVLMLGPVALLVGLPRANGAFSQETQ